MKRSIEKTREAGKQLWRQTAWPWSPSSEREAGESVVRNFLLHWFPAKVTERSLSFGYSFWLGTISAILFLVLSVTGGILMFLYVPSVERAYESIKDLEFVVSFGSFMRGLHRVAAHLMVAVVFIHMARVFLTGAYKNGLAARQNRPVNWIIGVVLLLATLLLSFTGYLLPWDQLAYWAITVGTNIASAAPVVGTQIRFFLLGGNHIDQNTLLRFYVLHCFFLPVFVLLLFAWHMWRIRKDGGYACVDALALGQTKERTTIKSKTYSLLGIARGRAVRVDAFGIDEDVHKVRSSPNLTRRLLLVTVATMLVLSLLTTIISAPLEDPANPKVTPNPAKAPWYFLWLQELVTITTIKFGGGFAINGALIGGIIVPGVLVGLLCAWPYLDRSSIAATGVWFSPERKRQNFVFLVVAVVILVLTFIGTFLRGPYWKIYWPWEI